MQFSSTKFRPEIFERNPLAENSEYKKEIERHERARLEKRIAEIQKEKGINNLKNVKNLDELIKGKETPAWNCGLEMKHFKNTLDIHMQSNSKFKKSNNCRFLNLDHRTVASVDTDDNAILRLDVNIDDSNRLEKLVIYPEQDPNSVVDEFCERFNIPAEKKERLQSIIEDRLSDLKK